MEQTASSAELAESVATRGNRHDYDKWLVLFVVVVAVPLNGLMFNSRIGLLGIPSETLPFKLTGILYYSRLYIVPLIIFWLYSSSHRTTRSALLVFGYALFSGFSATSRTVFILSFLPIAFFYFEEQKRIRFAITLVAGFVAFSLVSAGRQVVFEHFDAGYIEMVTGGVSMLLDDERVPVMLGVGHFANRFYGPEDIVMVSQYEVPEPWLALPRYFFSGGLATAVVPDFMTAIFGMEYGEDSGFGVGIGIIAYLAMMGKGNLLLVLVGSFVVALLLSVGNSIVEYASRELFGRKSLASLLFLSVVVSFSLYSSSINFFVLQIVFLFVLALILKRRRLRDDSRSLSPR